MSRLYLLILLLFPLVLHAQITAPGSRTVRMTDYPVTLRDDPVFIFCAAGASDRGILTAASPGGTAPFTFSWSKYDITGGSFSIPVKTETGVTSTASSLDEGGYRVTITDGGGYSTDLFAWISLDKPVANAALQAFTCDYVALNGTAAPDHFNYYDPSTGSPRRLPNEIRFNWSSVPASTIPYPDLELNPVTFSPPLVDVEYMLQVTDSFGCATTSSFDYTSIHIKAEFTAEPTVGEAPLEVLFNDNSVRAYSYMWKFGDDSISSLPDPGPHVYYTPGDYRVTLVIESDLTCVDSASVTITVEPSLLQIPNVFTPNDDGMNDFFIPDKKSLKYINIQVFAKSGHRVYYYQATGDDLQNWTGWDGHINNSGRLADAGTYYYVIRATGYDDIKYEGREYRGALYLYR
ncbi:MAG: gliding motility-associated C-terminal domain-containing protein [Bacteroidales bacterium]|nr:gliding motility-associated C-terminal domain-containing protein [Bacteroidales bacterium]